MRKSLKRLTTVLIILLTASFNVFADTDAFMKPGINEVVLIGRIVVTEDVPKDFLVKSYGWENFSRQELDGTITNTLPDYHSLEIPRVLDWQGVINPEPVYVGIDGMQRVRTGDFFFIKIKKYSKNIYNLKDIPCGFYTMYDCVSYLPLNLEIDYNGKGKYQYIGSYQVDYTGDDFAIKNIKAGDEFDACLEMLEYYTKKPDLIRAKVKMLPLED